MPLGVKMLQVAQNVDERGQLCFMEVATHLPFEVRRVFWISGVPAGKTRGGHAHWTCHEAIFPVAGSFEIEVDDGEVCCTVAMAHPWEGITIPAGVWCELRNFAPGTVCFVLASEAYDASGYALTREAWHQGLAELKRADAPSCLERKARCEKNDDEVHIKGDEVHIKGDEVHMRDDGVCMRDDEVCMRDDEVRMKGDDEVRG